MNTHFVRRYTSKRFSSFLLKAVPSSLFKSWTTPEKREEENVLLRTLFLEKMTIQQLLAKDRRVGLAYKNPCLTL